MSPPQSTSIFYTCPKLGDGMGTNKIDAHNSWPIIILGKWYYCPPLARSNSLEERF
jgi:hypothetical protein